MGDVLLFELFLAQYTTGGPMLSGGGSLFEDGVVDCV